MGRQLRVQRGGPGVCPVLQLQPGSGQGGDHRPDVQRGYLLVPEAGRCDLGGGAPRERQPSGSTSASQIQETLVAGTYTVEATTNSAGATGPFTLTITVEYLPTANVSRAARSEGALVRPGSPISLTVAFSRPVSGFAIDDISVETGAAGNFAGSGAVYTFDVTPNAIGEVTVEIPAGVAEDADGNGNTAAPRFSLGITYDDDGDGTVSRAEAIAAIRDYFGGGLTRAQVIAVIRLYFASGTTGQ